MSLNSALALIRKCLETQEASLNLGSCSLTDSDFVSGSKIDLELRKCSHLESLILSDVYWDPGNGTIPNNNSDSDNKLTELPSAIFALENLTQLVYGGRSKHPWHINNLSLIAQLTKIKYLNLANCELTDIRLFKSLSNLHLLDISGNHLTNIIDLREAKMLEYLNVRRNKLSRIDTVSTLTSLKVLDARHNRIEKIADLSALHNLHTLFLHSNQIQEIDGLDQISSLQLLSISNNKLTEIKKISQFTSLKHLNIGANQIQNTSALQSLTSLQYLNISNNLINEIEGLTPLTALEHLNLSNNQFNQINGLDTLSALTYLNISNNNLERIPQLNNLVNLQELNLNSNKIVEIEGVENLTNLKHFDLRFNKLVEIKNLESLINLRSLYLSSNQITKLKGINNLENLQYLDVSNNKIKKIGNLENLIRLKSLDIFRNQISDLSHLSSAAALERLDINHNEINNLDNLSAFKNLQEMNVSFNQVTDISTLLPLLKRQNNPLKIVWKHLAKSTEISLFNNPLIAPPVEIVQQGTQSILDWFEAHKEKLNEIKVILIGDPKAGKTSLLRRLKDDAFDDKEPQTDGINIEDIAFGTCLPFRKQESLHTLTAHFWDFGGQEIMNATHQFFLTNRSIYLLVLDARKDQKVAEQVRMWVKRIKTTGGNSPIIVVANQADINPGFGFSNEIDLQKEFPQIKCFLKVSCLTGDGIEEIKQKLEELIPTAELFNTEIDERWIRIMKQLQNETKSKHYLDETRFNNICDENGLQKSSRKNAINFLNDLGLILHFDSLNLAEYYVLDPYWITYGVYQIVTSAYAGAQKGIVPMDKLEYIVNEEEDKKQIYQPAQYQKIVYDSTNQRRFLIDILNQFKLCFYMPGNTHFIIPDLLDTTEPVLATRPIREDGNAISFVYDYEYMPSSIMPSIMVEGHWLLKEKWRTGCILAYSGCQALVSGYQNKLTIIVIGEHKKKREFMAVVRNLVDEINRDLADKPKMLIPLMSGNAYAEYEVLLAMERKGRKEYIFDEFKPTEKEFEISQLLEGIPGDEEMKEIRILSKKILASTERMEIQLDEQFYYLVKKSNADSDMIINAVQEIPSLQTSSVLEDIMEFLANSFEIQNSELDEKLKGLYADLKRSDDMELKLKLSIPFIKLLGIDLEAKFDVKSWSKKMHEKYRLPLFKLLT